MSIMHTDNWNGQRIGIDMLSEEDKQKIKDFMTGKSSINPDTWISKENMKEGLEYADLVANQRVLRTINEICKVNRWNKKGKGS